MAEMTARLPLAISMGCPVGIGPEIAVRFLATEAAPPAVIIGDPLVLEQCARQWAPGVRIQDWQPGRAVLAGAINVLPVSRLADLAWGKPDVRTGQAMASYIAEAVALVRAGELAALVTCPITKTGLRLAGYAYPGHTEMLADLCQTENFGMMLAGQCRAACSKICYALCSAIAACASVTTDGAATRSASARFRRSA